jgi:transposase
MSTMEKREQRPRRTFTPEFKAEVVELCQAGDRSIGQVARALAVRRSTREQTLTDKDGRRRSGQRVGADVVASFRSGG